MNILSWLMFGIEPNELPKLIAQAVAALTIIYTLIVIMLVAL